MSNMSYCRFENTLGDLSDCQDALLECDKLSEREAEKALRLIAMCKEIAEEFGDCDLADLKELGE